MFKNFICIILCALLLTACGKSGASSTINSYTQIDAEAAMQIMDSVEDYVLLDVRTQSEFEEGHIKNAVLIPDTEIESRAEKEITDKSALILVYCRSGRRSKEASQKLVDLGYTNVKDFGGIVDWPYEIVK